MKLHLKQNVSGCHGDPDDGGVLSPLHLGARCRMFVPPFAKFNRE
jgi:hypothetical protein